MRLLFRDSDDWFSLIKSIEEIIKMSVRVRVGQWLNIFVTEQIAL